MLWRRRWCYSSLRRHECKWTSLGSEELISQNNHIKMWLQITATHRTYKSTFYLYLKKTKSTFFFLLKEYSQDKNLIYGCLEGLWRSRPCRHSGSGWMVFWAAWSGWDVAAHCRGTGLDDFWRSKALYDSKSHRHANIILSMATFQLSSKLQHCNFTISWTIPV